MRLEHLNLTVSDLDRAADFYLRLFDLRVRWKGHTTGGTPAIHVGTDSCYFALFEGRNGTVHNDYGEVGVNHIGVQVDDIEATKKRAVELGGTFSFENAIRHEGTRGWSAYIYDPDGNEIELVSYESEPG